MISMFLDCAKVWTRLVQFTCRLTRRPQVTYQAPPMPPGGRAPSTRARSATMASTEGTR